MRACVIAITLLAAAPTGALALGGDGAPLDDPAAQLAVGTLHQPDAFCVATRIAPRWILTARHCTEDASGPVTFQPFAGPRRPVTRWYGAPQRADVALGAIPDDHPAAPPLPLHPQAQPCSSFSPAQGIDTAWIASLRHNTGEGIVEPVVGWRGAIGPLFRDCSAYSQGVYYFRGALTDGTITQVCGGDSGSPVIDGGAVRGIVVMAVIRGVGNCSDQPEAATGFMDPIAPLTQWIQDITVHTPMHVTPVRVIAARRTPRGGAWIRWTGRRSLLHGPAEITWLRGTRPVRRDTITLRPEWTRQLLRRAPRTPGIYRLRIRSDDITRITPPFRLGR